ncbi:flagellin, partial [Salinibacter ruber]|uniref:flagellin n=1 Tax=Salinibacter ruber TaxID=146919 RepID=UPI002342E221
SFVFQTGADSTSTFEVATPDASTSGDTLDVSGDINLAGSAGDGVSLDAGDFAGGGNNSLDSFSVPSDLSSADLSSGGNNDQINADVDSNGNLAGDLNGGKFNVTVTNAENDTSASPSELNLEFDVEGKKGTQVLDVNSAGAASKDSTLVLETDGSNEIKLDADQLFDDGAVQANESKEFSVTVKDQEDIGERLDGGSANNARAIIDDVDTAINNVTSELSNLGASQNRLSFKESNLETSRTNLNAAQSRIEDADFAKEQTQVAKLQVQQQSGTAQLAQANAAGQSVLSLLQ